MQTEQLDAGLVRCVAPNGLRVLSESLPGVRSAAVGIWVRSASVHEPARLMGISHLLEHMVFKGTERRSARQLALELETRGGSLDAYTSRDHTAFQAHVLDADLPVAVEVLTDLVRRPLLRASDLELERHVILEELSSVHDAPDDLVFELHARALWPDHPYGYSILGTAETVQGITADDLRAAHHAGYYPGNCIIAAAGNVNHDQLMTVLEREGWFEGAEPKPAREPVPSVPRGPGSPHRHSPRKPAGPPGFRNRHGPEPRSEALRLRPGLDHHGWRNVEPALSADSGRAGSGLLGLLLSAVLPDDRRVRSVPRYPG